MLDIMRMPVEHGDQMNSLIKNMIGLSSGRELSIDLLRMAKAQETKPLGPFNYQHHQHKTLTGGKDRLSGMMTDKEKNWVVSVQMLQLQNDDPYSYDFYYTVSRFTCFLRFKPATSKTVSKMTLFSRNFLAFEDWLSFYDTK